MESKTPLTDAEAFMLDDGMGEAVMSDFARRLERALAVAEEALRPLAKIAPLAEKYHTLGGWRIVLESGSHRDRIELVGADAFAARAALAQIEELRNGK